MGPPGTGKTEYLAGRTRDAVLLHGRRVAIASLTNTAAAEIRDRTGISDRSMVAVGTLHKLCMEALGVTKKDLAASHLAEWNETPAVQRQQWTLTGSDSPEEGRRAEETRGDRLLAMIEDSRHRMIPRPSILGLEAFETAYTAWKRDAGYLDFTDCIEEASRSTRAPLVGGEPPDTLVLDECQDSTRLELHLVREVWGENVERVILAGDPDQTLYGFRSADPRVFLDYTPTHAKTLAQSYRVPRAVHAYAQALIRRIQDRADVDYHPRDAEGELLRARHSARLPEALLREVLPFLADGSVMVLGATRFAVAGLVSAARAMGVPFSNPWAPKRGEWNPLRRSRQGQTSTLDRFLAFLAPGRPEWTRDDLLRWIPALRSQGVLQRGALTGLEAKLSDPWLSAELVALFCDEDALIAATARRPSWLLERVKPTLHKLTEYLAKIHARGGAEALVEAPMLHFGTVHCSPPDEPILTRRGYVPIGDLCEDDRLIAYDPKSHRLLGLASRYNSTGFSFERSERPYQGELIVMETEHSRTRVTPNHRVLARLREDFFGQWVVYLMRRGSWWRVGVCTSGHRPYRSGGVAGRLATEQADAGWILAVCKTREEAIETEALIQAQYGIPGLTFESAKQRALVSTQLHAIHDRVSPFVGPRAAELLRAYGSDPEWPLYRRGGGWKKNMRAIFTVEAGTLAMLAGWVDVPVFTGPPREVMAKTSITREQYEGSVFGLEVPPYRHYVSGGAIVHNSVKGATADTVVLLPDVTPAMYQEAATREGMETQTRTFYVGATRARTRLVLVPPSSRRCFPL